MHALQSLTVPDVVFGATSLINASSVSTSTECAEALFYSFLKFEMQPYGRTYNWIRQTAIERLSLIQTLFNIASLGTCLYYAKTLYDELPSFSVTPISNFEILTLNKEVAILGGVIGVFALAIKLSRFLASSINPLSQTEERSFEGKNSQMLQMAKMVFNLGLACLPNQRFLASLRLIPLGYSFWKNLSLKWSVVSGSFPFTNGNIRHVSINYKTLAVSQSGDFCPICHENEQETPFINVAACAHHLFHRECLQNWLQSKLPQIVEQSQYQLITTQIYRDGRHIGDSHSCSVNVNETLLPHCPMCQESAPQNQLSFSVTDSQGRRRKTFTHIIRPFRDRAPLFDKFYTVYSLTGAALAYLQTYSELAAHIFQIQKWMVPLNCFTWAVDYSYLVIKLEKRVEAQGIKVLILRLAAAVTAIAMAAFSYLIVHQANLLLRPDLLLEELSQKLVIANIPSAIQVTWTNPILQELLQTVSLMQLGTAMAQVFLSTERRGFHLTSAVAHLASLVGLSRLNWITLSASVSYPLKQFVQAGVEIKADSLYLVDKMTLKATFMVDRIKTSSLPSLSSSLQSVLDKMHALFDLSSWDLYEVTQYSNGIVARWDECHVTLIQSPFQLLKAPFLTIKDFSLWTGRNYPFFKKEHRTVLNYPWM